MMVQPGHPWDSHADTLVISVGMFVAGSSPFSRELAVSQLREEITLFSVESRNRVRDRVLQLAASDARDVTGAIVGSLAHAEGDRWSDLDLTFAIADTLPLQDVLADWTRTIVDEFDAAHLFDLPSGASIYRVFLLPECLKFDPLLTPAAAFGATGPKFKLLLGSAVDKLYAQPLSAHELFGMRCARVFASNGAAAGRPSTGSAACATTP